MDEAEEADDPCTGDHEEARIHLCFPLARLTIGVHRTRAAQRAGWSPVERDVRHGSALGVLELSTFGLGNWVAELASGIEPEVDCFASVRESLLVAGSMSHAAGKLRNVCDKRLVLVAPENDDLVPSHLATPPNHNVGELS